jgi:hypothetical protein
MRIRLKATVVPEYPCLRVCLLFLFHLHNFCSLGSITYADLRLSFSSWLHLHQCLLL